MCTLRRRFFKGGDVPWFEMLGIFSLSVCAACKCKFGRTGDGSIKVEWIPLEGVSSGELKLKIEAIKVEDQEGSRGSTNGWIELVVIEARDLIVADLRGTSDPYVRSGALENFALPLLFVILLPEIAVLFLLPPEICRKLLSRHPHCRWSNPQNPLHCRKTHIVLAGTHRTPYTAGKPTLSSLEPTEPPTQPENPYCRRSNPTEPTLSWLEENPTYTVATRVLKHSSVLKGQSFLREVFVCDCTGSAHVRVLLGSLDQALLWKRFDYIFEASNSELIYLEAKESLVKNFNAFGATLTEDETKKLSGMDFFL
ncbi:hypothetical protein JHK86_027658 [Glycine max]|nr:hypothetical protein JHK86_027658 [Glycine max]